jgi:hypothetical protein
MSNHKNLIWFNKEGDFLNFNYNETSEKFEGNILFHENSTDTFKTAGLYMMEKVPSFSYELPGELTIEKFQLFNDYGLHLYSGKYKNQYILGIKPINNDSNFYSKWIFGDNFEKYFPLGTLIVFDTPFLEFTNINKTYTVVGSKKGAIMIISQMDNATFESSYFSIYAEPIFNIENDYSISSVNAIGVYDYLDVSNYQSKLSLWSEPFFYDKLYLNKRLNIVKSQKQIGDDISKPPFYSPITVSINNIDIPDQTHFEYSVKKNSLPQNSNLIIEVFTRMDLSNIYEGEIEITNDGRLILDDVVPRTLRSGKEIKIINSVNNTNFYTVSYMPEWSGISVQTFFATQSQVFYENRVYECVQAYTQSFSDPQTIFVNPSNPTYWKLSNFIRVDQSTVAETVLLAQIYYTTDKYYFETAFTQSQSVTLASAAEQWKEDLRFFNIDIFYEKNTLRADLIYPSKYAIVNFYHTQVGSTYSIGTQKQTVEKLVGIEQYLNYELNYDISENFSYNIVFTDLDEYGLKIFINKELYDEEIVWVYTGAQVDMERTIDATLRKWLVRNYIRLVVLGIRAELKYIGNYTSIFYNSIVLKTEYPNIPMNINEVKVGETAKFYIEHSQVVFNSGSYSIPYINVNINGDDYLTQAVSSQGYVNIPATLQSWVNEHSESLLGLGYLITNINYILKFDLLSLEIPLKYTVSTGRVNLPGLDDYAIIKKIKGNHGMLITSNQVLLPESSTASFEIEGFATGRVISINNTHFPWNNQEYNIQFLDPHIMNLSYQGPFWGLTDSICNSSAFVTLAFDTGFGQTACAVPGPTGTTGAGPYNISSFSQSAFSLSFNPNTYQIEGIDLSGYVGSSNLVDIEYVQISNSIYIFGDGLNVIDSNLGLYIASIDLPGNTQSIEMEFNLINNYLYCLSEQQINIIDPTSNLLIHNISLTASFIGSVAFDLQVNPINGDVYVTYANSPRIDIWSFDNFSDSPTAVINSVLLPPFTSRTGKIVFNSFEGDMYVTTDSNFVVRINGSGTLNRTIQTQYTIIGLTHSMFYEPVNESIYVYGSASLWKIDNDIAQSISVTTGPTFNEIIFNNISNQMNISDDTGPYGSGVFSTLNLSSNVSVQNFIINYGYLEINQFDGDLYLSSQNSNEVVIINSMTGLVKSILPQSDQTGRMVYNPDRKSIWALQPGINSVIEIMVDMASTINLLPVGTSISEDNQYGTLDPNYVPRQSIWLSAKEYVRRPRENYEGDVAVKYYYKWITDFVPEFFMYDFSGQQLPTSGPYAYTGPKPIEPAILTRRPNNDLTKVSLPEYQQTIFDKVEWTLNYVDDEEILTQEVEPLELFIGFNSKDEGVKYSELLLMKKEEIEFSIETDDNNYITFDTDFNEFGSFGTIKINETSSNYFTDRGLKPGQLIAILLKDVSNEKNQYTSLNNASIFRVKEVYSKIILVDYVSEFGLLIPEKTIIQDYPLVGNKTYLRFTLRVLEREIGRFLCYAQTEDEDERFKIELGNIGRLISPDEVFIFKEYDILEGGIDWSILNRKRKEMLMMKHLIYPYIGSYKAIINAINYFGYNDLILNEYFRDIDPSSPNFGKNYKVKIPDIFDNSVEGWTENEYIKNTFPNEKYEETNTFNLSYFITDEQGNNVLNYTLDEVLIKLQGLKYWLRRNVIPLTHKIVDITGQAYTNNTSAITHKTADIQIFKMKDEMCPVTFKLNELYLMPVSSGSTVYNCVLDFYSIIPGLGASQSEFKNGYPLQTILPNSTAKLVSPDYYDIKIKTYKTYKEWAPFTTYQKGEKVTYYGRIYESMMDNNRVKNPRKYETAQSWSPNINYTTTSVVEYERDIYVFSGLGQTQSTVVTPKLDPLNWLKITEWKKIDLEPVQIIKEWRKGTDLLPFNFTIDSNIDPYLVIEVRSDNGYGQTYLDRKNYEIRGLKDITEPYQYIDPIGPFTPISPVY